MNMFTKETAIIILFFAILGVVLLGVSVLLGWLVKLIFSLSRNYGLCADYVLAGLSLFIALWGCTIGFEQFDVKHVQLSFSNLPKEFDGYRIIQITDAHVGSFIGRKRLLKRTVETILKENADLIVFTGDLQNRSPKEIEPFITELSQVKARDGVFAVLGNHDYGYPPSAESPLKVREAEEKAGWQVLVNEHVRINRGSGHIILAGMDNDGDGIHFPQRGDVAQTLNGTTESDFVVMLEHDPTSWRQNIIPNSNIPLTLSGHTHAMQFCLFGWSPSKWIYPEYHGLYTEGLQHLYISSGMGGVVPFRFGMPREMVVIELKRD